MFIQANGKNEKQEDVTFIARTPEHLLEVMERENIEKCLIEPNDVDYPIIEFFRVTKDDVREWIKTGYLKGEKK